MADALAGRPHRTGLAHTVLAEIALHLDHLARTGEPAAIDLLSLPLTLDDRAELAEALGRGEVEALVQAAGGSEVWETAYAGVWWVRHSGIGDRIAAERVEITPVPEILAADPADMAEAAARLRRAIDGRPDRDSQEEAAHG